MLPTTLLKKRRRKLPKKTVIPTNLISQDSNHLNDDPSLYTSEHDRLILSEIFDKEQDPYRRNNLPHVVLGLPKTKLIDENLQPTRKIQVYKERFKEKRDDFILDLSKHRIIPKKLARIMAPDADDDDESSEEAELQDTHVDKMVTTESTAIEPVSSESIAPTVKEASPILTIPPLRKVMVFIESYDFDQESESEADMEEEDEDDVHSNYEESMDEDSWEEKVRVKSRAVKREASLLIAKKETSDSDSEKEENTNQDTNNTTDLETSQDKNTLEKKELELQHASSESCSVKSTNKSKDEEFEDTTVLVKELAVDQTMTNLDNEENKDSMEGVDNITGTVHSEDKEEEKITTTTTTDTTMNANTDSSDEKDKEFSMPSDSAPGSVYLNGSKDKAKEVSNTHTIGLEGSNLSSSLQEKEELTMNQGLQESVMDHDVNDMETEALETTVASSEEPQKILESQKEDPKDRIVSDKPGISTVDSSCVEEVAVKTNHEHINSNAVQSPNISIITPFSQAIVEYQRETNTDDESVNTQEWMKLDSTDEEEDKNSKDIFDLMAAKKRSVSMVNVVTEKCSSVTTDDPVVRIRKHNKRKRLRMMNLPDWIEDVSTSKQLNQLDTMTTKRAIKRRDRLAKRRGKPYITKKKINWSSWQ